jgi:sugar O-acyltransferase (sialic acid O-acetyltransferase NeuD family)
VTGLVLVAGSGLAAETIAAVRAAGSHDPLVILDDDAARWGQELSDVPIVGGVDEIRAFADYDVVVCAGRGTMRKTLVNRIRIFGVGPDRYARVVHPSVDVPHGCVVGRGSIVLGHVTLTAAVTIGSHVVVMPNTSITHDDHVSDFATLCAGVTLGGRVLVCEGAYVGMNASVREGLCLGAGSTLGMGSVLLEDLPPGETWAGVPSTPIVTKTVPKTVAKTKEYR